MEDFLNNRRKLEKIGQGFCGTVWSEDGGTLVIKRADGGPGRSLPNEDQIHTHILSAVAKYSADNTENEARHGKKTDKVETRESPFRIRVHIPLHVAFLEQSSTLWSDILPRLPQGFTACEALISERIPPMPVPVRALLASRCCPSPQQAAQLARDRTNASCLARPYLGRRRPGPGQAAGPRRRFFSLRNLPLHMDQLEALGLPVDDYAAAMADALAFLHWVARVDAGDVEYVLAPSRGGSEGPCIGAVSFSSEAFGEHGMWILDFDCCRPLEMSGAGMRRAAMCFWRNDPFYPRPGARGERDRQMWEAFERRFLETSDVLLRDEGDEARALPGVLMTTIRENRDTWTKSAIS